MQGDSTQRDTARSRHSAVVRVTHWVSTVAFFALFVTGIEIVLSHPRFYWGETGNVNTHPLFTLHIASSRATVPTGYRVLEDQNGWSRSLHFQAAWAFVLTGLLYGAVSLWNGHFRNDLLPARTQRNWGAFRGVISGYLRGTSQHAGSYNAVQRVAYAGVVFVLVPMMIWTGLAMSPSFTSAFPLAASLLGGRQSARTLHFFLTNALVLFLLVHVAMVIHAGFWSRMRSMTIGGAAVPHEEEQP